MTTRDYDKGALRIHWDSSRCIHTAICLRHNPAAFDVRRRPWVDVDAATEAELVDTVQRCPTGALSYTWTDDTPGEQHDAVEVRAVPGGPLFVRGDIDLVDEDGQPIDTAPRAALCRCGRSGNAPLCDGSHRRRPRTAAD